MNPNIDMDKYYVKIIFKPKWAFIGHIRGFIENFVFSNIKNMQLGKKVALTASELLENAVKYSSQETISIEMKLSGEDIGEKATVLLNVKNYTDKKNIEQLQSFIETSKIISPEEAFKQRFKEIFTQDLSQNESRLGLLRLRYEANAVFDIQITEENFVSINVTIV